MYPLLIAGLLLGMAPAPPVGVVDHPVRTTGCGHRPDATRTVVSGGVSRSYVLHLP